MRFATRGGRLALLLLSTALATPASAQDYPPSTDAAALSAWLEKTTNITPSTVVSVTPELVVAIVGKTMPASPGGPVRLTLREEIIAAEYVPTVGGRSSLMSMEIQCEERRVRMDERRLHVGPNLTGGVEITEPSAEWVRIPESSIMDEVARAACDSNYIWPLQVATVKAPAVPNIAVAALELTPQAPPPPEEPKIEAAPAPAPEALPPEKGASEIETAAEASASGAAQPVEVVAPPQPQVETDPLAKTPQEETAAPEESAPPPAPAPPMVEPAPPPEIPAETELAQTPSVADPVASPPGPVFAVQIGAYDSRDAAEAAWAALSANRPILVEDFRFDIRPARVNGKTWLRGLVRDFATRQDAAAFCSALAGTEYGCILRTIAD